MTTPQVQVHHHGPLVVDLRRSGRTLTMRVLEQGENLRGVDLIAKFGTFSLYSEIDPQIDRTEMFIRGVNAGADDIPFTFTYPTESAAISAESAFRAMIAAVNAGAKGEVKRYRKVSTIEAVQWFKMGDHPAVVPIVVTKRDPNNPAYVLPDQSPRPNLSPNAQDYFPGMESTHGVIETLEGRHIVSPGDWIATGAEGEHWPIKPHIFAKTYVPDDGSSDSAFSAGAASRDGEVAAAKAIIARYESLNERETAATKKACELLAQVKPRVEALESENKALREAGVSLSSWCNLAAHRGIGGDGPSREDLLKAIDSFSKACQVPPLALRTLGGEGGGE